MKFECVVVGGGGDDAHAGQCQFAPTMHMISTTAFFLLFLTTIVFTQAIQAASSSAVGIGDVKAGVGSEGAK